jgi:hypothetical protein
VHSRLATLKRLRDVYGVVEEMHSAELQRAAAAVREAQHAIGAQQNVVRSARSDGREALEPGDRVGWTTAEVLREAASSKQRRLESICIERESVSDAARERHVASRLKREQMQRLVVRETEHIQLEEGRKMQAASDDRFLARQRWAEDRAMRANARMKAS